MKHLLTALFALAICFSAGTTATAQLPGPGNIDWMEKWTKFPPASPDPQEPNYWMFGNRSYTGLAVDTARKVVYVVNPGYPPRVRAFDMLTGDPALAIGGAHGAAAGELHVDTSVVHGGYDDFSLYKIDVDDEGRIFACNVVVAGDTSRMFRIYKWETDTSVPELVYEYHVPQYEAVMGHVFEVVNKRHSVGAQTHDSTRIFVCSVAAYANVAVDGELHIIVPDRRTPPQQEFRLAQIVRNPVPALNMFGGGLATTSRSGHGDLYVGAPGQIIRRIRQFPDTGSMPVTHDAVIVDSVHDFGGAPIGGGPMEYLSDSRFGDVYAHLFLGRMKPTSTGVGTPNANTVAESYATSLGMLDYWMRAPQSRTPAIGANNPNLMSGDQAWVVDMDFTVYVFPDTTPWIGRPYALIHYLSSNNGIGCFLSREEIRFPVELSSFNAWAESGIVTLNWSTASETNNYGFEIERSTGGAWERIDLVSGYGTTTMQQEYRWNEPITPAMQQAGTVRYRLRQVDFDGTFEYSPIVDVVTGAAPEGIELHQNYPNPFRGSTSVSFNVPAAQPVTLSLYNTLGQPVQSVEHLAQPGRNTVQLTGIQPGIYMLVLRGSTGVRSMRIVGR